MFIIPLIISTTVLLSASPLLAAVIKISDDPRCRVQVVGAIERGDATSLKQLENHLVVDGPESTAGSVLCLDSPGGSVIEGMAMAEVILEKGISTKILENDICASICAVMFMMGNFTGSEVAGLSRSMHFTSLLGFHRPYLTADEARQYTSTDIDNVFDLGMETIFDFLEIANQREPWGTAQMIEADLLQVMLGTPGDEMYYVRAVEEAARWKINVDGVPTEITPTSNRLHYACENALAHRIGLTSTIGGPNGILSDAIFGFMPLNQYSIARIANGAAEPYSRLVAVQSGRSGYSTIGCQVQAQRQSVAVCGYDESTDVRVGNCGGEYGMRYFPLSSMLHPRTQLATFAFSDNLEADARRVTECKLYDAAYTLTENEVCLQSVVLMVENNRAIARHYITWPSGSRTIIDIGGAAYGETSDYVRINGGSGKRTELKGKPSCITNQSSGNLICLGG